MLATIRRTALAIAGIAALAAAGAARADHDDDCDRGPGFTGDELPGPWQPQEVHFSVALPPPPAWLAIAPPPTPAYQAWSRNEILRQGRWLDLARARFYRFGAWNPWRVRQFEAWYQARHAELDRRWAALAWAPGPRHGWRGEGWKGRFGEGWERGRWGGWRWERHDD